MPGGRPTVYKEQMIEDIIPLAEQGMSMLQIAAHWGIDVTAMRDWAYDGKHPEFTSSYMRAKTAYLATLNNQVAEGIFDNKDKRLNHVAVRVLYLQAGESFDDRRIVLEGLDDPDPAKKRDAAFKHLGSGRLTVKEAEQLLNILALDAKIEENLELRHKVEQLEELVAAQQQKINV